MGISPAFIQIDERLPPSRVKRAVWGGAWWVIVVMIGLLPLPLHYRLLLGVLAGLCVGLDYVIHPQLVAISTLPIHPLALNDRLKRAGVKRPEPLRLNTIEWQLAVTITSFAHSPRQLWQGYLIDITDTGNMLRLRFCIIEPHVRQYQFSLWQDQCTPDSWRQLKTISHVIGH